MEVATVPGQRDPFAGALSRLPPRGHRMTGNGTSRKSQLGAMRSAFAAKADYPRQTLTPADG